ncbi:MAG: AAA family ATPase [candidate division Zixibacteria bacterium]|nr:AAA family ATPase [candidate division Zixibacteria bacterium]
MPNRIHIFGASGTGTTTLAIHLADFLKCVHLDVDDYFWIPTDPPYREIRGKSERLVLLRRDLEKHADCVFSGCISGWGDSLAPLISTAVFVSVPTDIRMQRLLRRERERFGETALAPGGAMHEQHVAFVAWAEAYETADENTRSRKRHEAWIRKLDCRVVRIENSDSIHEVVRRLFACIQ